MKQAIKIAVTGTHSTGKTTFLTTLHHELRAVGHAVATVADLGEEAHSLGFEILHRHTPSPRCGS